MLLGILVIKCPVNRGRFSKCPEGVARGTFTKPLEDRRGNKHDRRGNKQCIDAFVWRNLLIELVQ